MVKKTGELLIKKRCSHGQKRLVFNQAGRPGPRGATGATGPAAPDAWALVAANGPSEPSSSSGISSSRVALGTYQISITAPLCAGKQNDPTLDVADSNPPAGQVPGSFPEAWATLASSGSFTVYTGVVVNGVFSAADRTFAIQDVCGS